MNYVGRIGYGMYLEQPGIRVTDLRRSLRFYTRALGLREVRRGDTRWWGGGIWVLLKDPRTRRVLELNWYPKGSMFHSRYTVGDALDHIDVSIGVRSAAELEKAYRRLLRLGARPTKQTPSTNAGWSAGVLDPDGIWIQLSRRPSAAERRQLSASRPKSRRATR